MNKKCENSNVLEELISNEYVPSSLERKKSIMMYFLIGILIGLSGSNLGKYEKFHMGQAIGWWFSFIGILCLSIVILFVPYLNVFPAFLFSVLFVFWLMFVVQAWKGTYTILPQVENNFNYFFLVGSWLMGLFEVEDEQ